MCIYISESVFNLKREREIPCTLKMMKRDPKPPATRCARARPEHRPRHCLCDDLDHARKRYQEPKKRSKTVVVVQCRGTRYIAYFLPSPTRVVLCICVKTTTGGWYPMHNLHDSNYETWIFAGNPVLASLQFCHRTSYVASTIGCS
jgi:hypothetical protein